MAASTVDRLGVMWRFMGLVGEVGDIEVGGNGGCMGLGGGRVDGKVWCHGV